MCTATNALYICVSSHGGSILCVSSVSSNGGSIHCTLRAQSWRLYSFACPIMEAPFNVICVTSHHDSIRCVSSHGDCPWSSHGDSILCVSSHGGSMCVMEVIFFVSALFFVLKAMKIILFVLLSWMLFSLCLKPWGSILCV